MSISRKIVESNLLQNQDQLLNKMAEIQSMMGIGSGTDVFSSGEQVIFTVLKSLVPPPFCIFDVGSNQGQFLKLILDNLGENEFSIHCFEPGHETYKILTESCKPDKRIVLNNFGISKEQGKAVLHYDKAGSGLASLTKRRLDHFGIDLNQAETVKINTIDNYCSERAIKHINLLKIDIEGHELDALAGAKKMFEKKEIDIVTFEFGGCNIDTRTFFQDFWYFFKEADMSIFRITPDGHLCLIERYHEIQEQFRTMNFIATSNK